MVITESESLINPIELIKVNETKNNNLDIFEKLIWSPSIELKYMNKGIYSKFIADSIYLDKILNNTNNINKVKLSTNLNIKDFSDIVIVKVDLFLVRQNNDNLSIDKFIEINSKFKNIILDLSMNDIEDAKYVSRFFEYIDRYVSEVWSILGIIIPSSVYLNCYDYLSKSKIILDIPNIMIINDINDENEMYSLVERNIILNRLKHKLVIMIGDRSTLQELIDFIKYDNIITYKDIINNFISIIDTNNLSNEYLNEINNLDILIINNLELINKKDNVIELVIDNKNYKIKSDKIIIFEKDFSLTSVCKFNKYENINYISYKDNSDVLYFLLTKMKYINN